MSAGASSVMARKHPTVARTAWDEREAHPHGTLRVVYCNCTNGELGPRDTDGNIVDAMPRTPREGYNLADAQDYAKWMVQNTAWTNGTAHVQERSMGGQQWTTVYTYSW